MRGFDQNARQVREKKSLENRRVGRESSKNWKEGSKEHLEKEPKAEVPFGAG